MIRCYVKYVDVNLDTDWVKRGETIKKAQEMVNFIHYSFPHI